MKTMMTVLILSGLVSAAGARADWTPYAWHRIDANELKHTLILPGRDNTADIVGLASREGQYPGSYAFPLSFRFEAYRCMGCNYLSFETRGPDGLKHDARLSIRRPMPYTAEQLNGYTVDEAEAGWAIRIERLNVVQYRMSFSRAAEGEVAHFDFAVEDGPVIGILP